MNTRKNQRFFVSRKSSISVKILIGILMFVLTSWIVSATLVISTGDSGITPGTNVKFANATELDKYNVAHNLVNQIPDPAEPGKYVEMRWKIENFGTKNAENVIVELLPEYPFSLDPGEGAIQNVGSVWGRQIGEKGVMIYYKLRVDKDAVEGNNQIKLRYSLDNGKSWLILDPFNVRIRTQDAILGIESISSEFDTIKPGEISLVKIKLRNLADSLLKDIKIKLDIDKVPFAPIGSINEKIIKNLNSGETKEIEFNLMAEPNAESNVYKVPIKIDYMDWSGNKYVRNGTVGLVIGDIPDLLVGVDSSEIVNSGKTGKVVIKFTNKGLTDIKLLNFKLKPSDAYIILSPSQEYIGNIDSDDYETAEFNLYVKKTSKEIILLPLELEYKDANNKEYKKDVNVELKLYTKTETQKYGLQKKSKVLGIIITLVIIGLGLFVYIRCRKKRKPT